LARSIDDEKFEFRASKMLAKGKKAINFEPHFKRKCVTSGILTNNRKL
jgi:hypothetical protein